MIENFENLNQEQLRECFEKEFIQCEESEVLEKFRTCCNDKKTKDYMVFLKAMKLTMYPEDNPLSEEKIRDLARKLLKIKNQAKINSKRKILAEELIISIFRDHINVFLKGVHTK